MRIGILRPLEVTSADGTPVAVGGPRPRALLVLLALNANRVVGVDAIVAAQYGDEPPTDAAGAVQAHVSRLRGSVGVEFDGVGYRLAVDPDDVDALRFERLAGEGHRLLVAGAHDKAAAVLWEAGELHRAGGDHTAAFGRYTELFRPYAKVSKQGTAGKFLAPGTSRGIRMRNWMFNRKALFGAMMKLTNRFATRIDLPTY